MYCHNCGTKLPDDSAFCPNCGQAVIKEGTGTTASPPPPPKKSPLIPQGSGLSNALTKAYRIQMYCCLAGTCLFVILYVPQLMGPRQILTFEAWESSFRTLALDVLICGAIQVAGTVVAGNNLKPLFRDNEVRKRILSFKKLRDGDEAVVKTVNNFIEDQRLTFLVISNILGVILLLAVIRQFYLAFRYLI